MAGYREFQTGEVLTSANVNDFLMNQSVMVFADAAARNTALGTAVGGSNALVEGMLTYNQDSSKLEIYNGTSWAGVSAVKKIEAFTASGTWTVPAGVTYAIAHMIGGGGGAGRGSSGSGGATSVAFSGGTVSSNGGSALDVNGIFSGQVTTAAGPANSGRSAFYSGRDGANAGSASSTGNAGDSQWVVAGDSVTPAATISVTVGDGGSAGTGGAAGGSGYVYIEYYE